MKRVAMQPRPAWQDKCQAVGFNFHSLPSEDGQPYWRESAAYQLTMDEVLRLEVETRELFDRCMDAVEFVVRQDRYKEFGIPEQFWPLIKASWDRDDPTVFGRFDLCWQADGPAKLLEFNADTPTSLVESAVAQWFWLKDTMGHEADQFNSLHEKLVDQWRHVREKRWNLPEGAPIHMASLHDGGNGELIQEDYDNVAYMAEVASAAGFRPKQIFVEDISWNQRGHNFTDREGQSVLDIYKLYPWEWLVHEQYAPHIVESWGRTRWIEPIWKMLLSNKQLLVVLWELFPGHPNLLPAFNTDVPLLGKARVRKPKLGREGANVAVLSADGLPLEHTEGGYGDEGHVWQEYCALPEFDGWRPVIGSWVVGDEPAGVNFRETSGRITGDLAFFVPHYIA